jgi:hypothetical protein
MFKLSEGLTCIEWDFCMRDMLVGDIVTLSGSHLS